MRITAPSRFHTPSLFAAMTRNDVIARRNVRVISNPAVASINPICVQAFEPVLELHLLRLDEAEAGIMDLPGSPARV